jgi:DNA-binding MarR family transcriptional regulator
MASRTREKNATAIADALHSAAIHLLRRIRKADDRTVISPGRLSALSVLVFAGPMRLTDLARAEHVRPPTMTRIVAALEAGQLAQRKSDSTDARSAQIKATARGTRLMREARRRRIVKLAEALNAVSEEELVVLSRAAAIIERLSDAM